MHFLKYLMTFPKEISKDNKVSEIITTTYFYYNVIFKHE